MTADLACFNKVGVHDFTIRKKHEWSPLKVRITAHFSKKTLDDPQAFWNNVLLTDDLKLALFGMTGSHYLWHKHSSLIRTTNQLLNMVVVVRWCGCALRLHVLGDMARLNHSDF